MNIYFVWLHIYSSISIKFPLCTVLGTRNSDAEYIISLTLLQGAKIQESRFYFQVRVDCYDVRVLSSFLFCHNFRLELEVEPIFASMALYDGRVKKKVCLLLCFLKC